MINKKTKDMHTFIKTINGKLINLDSVKEFYIDKGEFASDMTIKTTDGDYHVVYEIPKEENDDLKDIIEYLRRVEFVSVGGKG